MPAERVLDDARMELYDDDVARLAPGELSGVYGVRIEAIAVAGTARQPNLLALRPRERGLEAPLLVRVVDVVLWGNQASRAFAIDATTLISTQNVTCVPRMSFIGCESASSARFTRVTSSLRKLTCVDNVASMAWGA